MRLCVIGIALLVIGCKGDTGPTGPQGPPGDNGDGVEWHSFYGYVPTSGQVTITIPGLDMDCPPVMSIYFETSPGNWIQPNILDQFEQNGQDWFYLETATISDDNILLASQSAISTNRAVPFVIVIVSPVGYFSPDYDCP